MKSSLLGMLVTANCNLIIQVLKHKLRGVNCLQWVYCLLNASFGLSTHCCIKRGHQINSPSARIRFGTKPKKFTPLIIALHTIPQS